MRWKGWLILIVAFVMALLTRHALAIGSADQIMMQVTNWFTVSQPAGATSIARPTPFFFIEKNALYLFLAISIVLAALAFVLEVVRVIRVGRNYQSASIISLAFVALFFDFKLFVSI